MGLRHHDSKSNVNTCTFIRRETWEKVGVSWVEEGKLLEYSLKKTFKFVPEMSVGSENDTLLMVNVPLVVSAVFLDLFGNSINSELSFFHRLLWAH